MKTKIRLQGFLWLPFLLAAALSLPVAFLLRFEFNIPPGEQRHLLTALYLFIPVKALIFYFFGLHRISWRVASVFDLLGVTLANLVASVTACSLSWIVIGPSFSRSIYIMDGLVCFLICAGFSFSLRLYTEIIQAHV